jgi:hypothetical protein
MIPVMIQTIDKFHAMGASPEHIVRFLQSHRRRDQQRQGVTTVAVGISENDRRTLNESSIVVRDDQPPSRRKRS